MTDRHFRLVGGLLVAALVVLVWGPTLRAGFLNYDDPQMILENPRLHDPGFSDAARVFTETREFAYLPVYVLALMPDAAFFGLDPAGFHLGSMLWHAIGAVLVLAFFHALTRSRTVSFVAAAVFAVHPMAAESVAWASGRKDQVSLVLLLLALAAALGHLRNGGWGRIVLASVLAAAAMLAKGSAVVYPLLAALLVPLVRVDRTIHPRARPLALLGLGALVAGAGALVHMRIAMGQGTTGGASFTTPWERFLTFLEALSHYGRSLVVPAPGQLSIHYEPKRQALDLCLGALWLIVLAWCSFEFWRRRHEPRAFRLFAGPWILFALLPFNGIFPETSVAMADRYAFNALPAFGIVVGVIVVSWKRGARVAGTIVILAILGTLSFMRAMDFRDSETVFRAARKVQPADSLVALKLAEALREKQPPSAHRAEALALMREAVALSRDPVREVRARLLLADTLLQSGEFEESARQSGLILALAKEHGAALRGVGLAETTVKFNEAAALAASGSRATAWRALDDVLEADPGHQPARLLRAGLAAQEALIELAESRPDVDRDRARENVNRSLETYERVIGELVEAGTHDGAAVADREIQARADVVRLLVRADWRADRLSAALVHAEAVIRRHPQRPEGYLLRAQIVREVDPSSAATDLRVAAALGSKSIATLRAVANGFLSLGKNREGTATLQRAREIDPADPGPVADLRGVYLAVAKGHLAGAEAGPDPKRAREALELARALGGPDPGVLELDAKLLDAEGRTEEAGATWEKLHALDPENDEGRKGLALFRQKHGLMILANLKRLAESAPADGRKARREELLAEVERDFQSAVKLAELEETAFARSWLTTRLRETKIEPILAGARVAAAQGDLGGASRLLEQAAALDPTYVTVAELQGHVAMQKGDDDGALAAFKRTLVLDQDNLAAHDALARLRMKRGETEALFHARRFLELAEKMEDPTSTLREETELMRQIVKKLAETRPESRR